MGWHTHGEDALGDTDGNAFEGPSAVLLQVQLPLEGVVHGRDQLPHRLEQALAPALLLPLERGPQQFGPTHDQVILELLGGEALVRDDQQSGPVGDQVFIDVEHGLEHFAFVEFRVRQRPQDRHSGRRASGA